MAGNSKGIIGVFLGSYEGGRIRVLEPAGNHSEDHRKIDEEEYSMYKKSNVEEFESVQNAISALDSEKSTKQAELQAIYLVET